MRNPGPYSAATLIVLSGLPATGKSTIGARVARVLGAAYVRIDTIEQAIADSVALAAPLGPGGYVVAYRVAEDQLRHGLSVVADSVNPIALTRDAWRDVAARHGARLVEVEVVCSDRHEHRRRAETRVVSIPTLVPPSWEEIESREYEPWARPVLVIDTAETAVDDCVEQILTAVRL